MTLTVGDLPAEQLAEPLHVVHDTWTEGLHKHVPEAIYHRRILGMVSKSSLTEIARTPLHYKAWVDGLVEDEETEALAFGRAFHCAVLEPARFLDTYVVAPDFGDCRFKENKARRNAWRAQNNGRTPLDAKDSARIHGMFKAIKAHPLASRAIAGGEAELTAYWTDAETGLRCRCRADYYVPAHRMVLDVKSTLDASPESFRRDVFKYKYHWQHAIYRSGFASVGEHVEHFVFVAVEKDPPHALAVYTLDDLGVSIAHDKVRLHIGTMAQCLKTNTWPGYSTGIQTIETPACET